MKELESQFPWIEN